MSGERRGTGLERGLLWGLLAGTLVAVALAAALVRFQAATRPAPAADVDLPVLMSVPAFSLLDQDGGPVTLDTLRGQPWIAAFVFTRCAISCPRMMAEARRLAPRLPAGAARIVLVTVDPENDTPPVVRDYLRANSAPADWLFLTGEPGAVRALVVDGFKLALGAAPPGPTAAAEPLLHSTRFVLVDAEGRVRGYYDAIEREAIERLLADVGRLTGG